MTPVGLACMLPIQTRKRKSYTNCEGVKPFHLTLTSSREIPLSLFRSPGQSRSFETEGEGVKKGGEEGGRRRKQTREIKAGANCAKGRWGMPSRSWKGEREGEAWERHRWKA